MACLVCSWIRPAIAIAPPDGISSVVSARRVLIEGIVSELRAAGTDCESVIAFSFDSSETSVITRRLIRPSVITTGVKLSEMPNFLKLIWRRANMSGRVAGIAGGTGNSPPAMNVADSPEMAVRFGSASVRTTPALSIARRVACTEGPLPNAPWALLPATSERPNAVNGLALLKFTTAVP